MRLIIKWLLSALVLVLIPYLIPGIGVSTFYTALMAALVLGLINALIKPLIVLLTLPFNILTLGLFTLIINALLFWFASTIVKGFVVAGFWPAFWGALVMTVLGWFINAVFKD